MIFMLKTRTIYHPQIHQIQKQIIVMKKIKIAMII